MNKLFPWVIVGQFLTILLLGALLLIPNLGERVAQVVTPKQAQTSVSSHFYKLDKSVLNEGLNTPWVTVVDSQTLLALSADQDFLSESEKLNGAINPNHTIYLGGLEPNSFVPVAIISLYSPLPISQLDPDRTVSHRTLDIVVNPVSSEANSLDVFISFSTAQGPDGCRNLNVSRFAIPRSVPDDSELRAIDGKLFFQSDCFPTSTTGDWRLHQSGGRIVFPEQSQWQSPEDQEILLSVGDFVKLAQNSEDSNSVSNQLSSVLRVTKDGWSKVAGGLRNPQGLALANLDGLGQVLVETEHGPRGGDELNLIRLGAQYDWPEFSYGTAYTPDNPNDKPTNEGRARGGNEPFFSWLPSIAPSQLLQVSGKEFFEWWSTHAQSSRAGDILVSTLGDQAIHRLRIESGQVRYTERIEVGERIRSFSQTSEGVLVLGTDSGKVIILQAVEYWSSEEGGFVIR